ncbi:MAG: bacterioferritin-associated ferredoxin [Beijerinckiaceae bacterium]
MIVCSCNILSDRQVRDVVETDCAPRKVSEVYGCLGCSPQCGRCARTIRDIMKSAGACVEAGPPDEDLPEAVLHGEA